MSAARQPPSTMTPDTTEMTPVSGLTDAEDIALAQKATAYLTAFRWCGKVEESYLALSIGYPLGVFLFHIEPRFVGVDDYFWVIVGDGPSAYLVCDDAPDWVGALRCYIYEMQRWIDAVRSGASLEGIIRVNVSPTHEHAEMLSSRLGFIQDHLIDGKPLPEEETAAPPKPNDHPTLDRSPTGR
jgi:hypothetical protein